MDNTNSLVNNPLVSIIIPSYNHEKYIEECILSIINQTYENIELIVIDDGSTDSSNIILTKLQQQYNFIYIHRPNQGLINTLNEAIHLAQGEFVSWMGSDDFFVPEKTQLQINFFNANPDFALCYGKMTFIDNNSKIIKEAKSNSFAAGYVLPKLLYKCFIPLPTIMVKKDILLQYGFDERFFLEDYPLWLKIAKSYKVGYVNETLTYYRLHGSNASANLIKMVREVERILDDWKDEPEYNKAIKKWYLRWFYDLARTDHFDETYEYMIKALPGSFYHPRYWKAAIRYFFKLKILKDHK